MAETKTKRARKSVAQVSALTGIDVAAVRAARRTLSKMRRAASKGTTRTGKDWSVVVKEQRGIIKGLKKDLKAAQRGEARALRVAQSFVDSITKSSTPNPAEVTTA